MRIRNENTLHTQKKEIAYMKKTKPRKQPCDESIGTSTDVTVSR